MVSVIEPQTTISNIWGKQKIDGNAIYRLMKYILRFDYCGNVYLHNVVTGHLVMLSQYEELILNKLPTIYSPMLNELIVSHFLVPEEYDEHQQVVNLRSILWKLHDIHSSKNITYYTILPTTECNARCWYCFEHGVSPATMSDATVDDTVRFITEHCGGEKVTIRWFGGEPTVAVRQIDQICNGLKLNNIEFASIITSNGYLLDEALICKAKNLWNLKSAMITVDGTETNYNKIKNYVNSNGSPYKTVLGNIKCLIDNQIYVGLRMNFTRSNYDDFALLLDDVLRLCSTSPYLQVYSHQVNADYTFVGEDEKAIELEEWYSNKILELNNLSRDKGLYKAKKELPCLYYLMCEAASDNAVVITPQGNLVSCGEQLGNDQIKGNLKEGITNPEIVQSWKQFVDFKKCDNCPLFPSCPSMLKCTGKDHCYRKPERMSQYETEVHRIIEGSKSTTYRRIK